MARVVGGGFTSNERNVLVLTGVAHTATHYAELMYPTLAVGLARDAAIPLDEVLVWSFPGYLLFGLGALPAGYLADRVGARPLLVGALAAMGLSTLLAGFSAPGPALALCLALLGCAGSVYHPVGMGLISHTMAARGRALGINGIFGGIGVALTPLATAALTAWLGWRGAFWVSGCVLLAFGAWFVRLPIEERRGAGIQPETAAAHDPPRRAGALGFLLLCAAAMLAGVSYRGNTLAQPAYFAERVSVMGYGAATSMAFLAGVIGQYAGGAIADRFDLRRGYLLFHLASLPGLLLMAHLAEVPLLLAAGTFTFFSLGMQPIENSLFAALTPPRWRSTGYGIKFVLTFGVGSVGVWLVAQVETALGLAAVFVVLAGVVILLVAVIALFGAVTAPMAAAAAPPGELAPPP
jgi:MFS family permease